MKEHEKKDLMTLRIACTLAWIVNLAWFMFLCWGVEFMIIEKGMEWMRSPKNWCMTGAIVTKVILSVMLLSMYNFFKAESESMTR